MPDLSGQTLGRYQLTQQLGEGGMASVYKAFDTRLDRFVAIKVILASHQESISFLKRFEREAKALARLSHPHIVKVHDYGEDKGIPYLVMEYIPGGTLKTRMGKPTPFQNAARLLAPIAHALEYAHQLDIIHRDVKPASILMTQSDLPMLSDFGIAKLLSVGDTTELTGTGVGIGTPEYMAPEQGQGANIDSRVDIYALGVVFYELITGRKPFQADTPMAVIIKQMTEPLPNPRRFVPEISEDVEKVILKALAKNPAERYQKMAGFASALENLAIQPSPSAAGQTKTTIMQPPTTTITKQPPFPTFQPPQPPFQQPEGPPYYQQQSSAQLAPAKRRNLSIWLIGGAIIILLSVFALIALGLGYIFLKPSNPTTTAVSIFELTQTPTKIPEYSTKTAHPQVIFTATKAPTKSNTNLPIKPTVTSIPPTPTKVLLPISIAFAEGDPGKSSIFIVDESGKNKTCIACSPDIDQAEPSWSPDGKSIAFQSNKDKNYDLFIIGRDAGQPQQLTNSIDMDEREPDWSIDNQIVYRSSPSATNRDKIGDLKIFDLNSRQSISTGVQGRGPVWSPDGTLIAYMSDENGLWQIYVFNPSSGETPKQITSLNVNCRWPSWSPDGQYIVFNITTDKASNSPDGIMSVNRNGDQTETLVKDNRAGRPNWSSSGYISFNTGAGIEIINSDGTNRQLLISEPSDWAPAWSR